MRTFDRRSQLKAFPKEDFINFSKKVPMAQFSFLSPLSSFPLIHVKTQDEQGRVRMCKDALLQVKENVFGVYGKGG
uniref:Uncharacterized protein n=1 Tax=Vespula pensylvanica TaxID=30213 RepID=A0A834P2K9_VESPE|nr:hypothetical protein H0235_008124 [Vespula pensylvanica]